MRNAAGGGRPDDGLRRLLIWTFAALLFTLIVAAVLVWLVIYWFDSN